MRCKPWIGTYYVLIYLKSTYFGIEYIDEGVHFRLFCQNNTTYNKNELDINLRYIDSPFVNFFQIFLKPLT